MFVCTTVYVGAAFAFESLWKKGKKHYHHFSEDKSGNEKGFGLSLCLLERWPEILNSEKEYNNCYIGKEPPQKSAEIRRHSF